MASLSKLDKESTGKVKLEGYDDTEIIVQHIERKKLRKLRFKYEMLASKPKDESQDDTLQRSVDLFDTAEELVILGVKEITNFNGGGVDDLLDAIETLHIIRLAGEVVEFNSLDAGAKKNWSGCLHSSKPSDTGNEATTPEKSEEQSNTTAKPAETTHTDSANSENVAILTPGNSISSTFDQSNTG